jgi:hypothetical protein
LLRRRIKEEKEKEREREREERKEEKKETTHEIDVSMLSLAPPDLITITP